MTRLYALIALLILILGLVKVASMLPIEEDEMIEGEKR